MKINLNNILTIFGAVQTIVEVVKQVKVSVSKKKSETEKAPDPVVEETKEPEA